MSTAQYRAGLNFKDPTRSGFARVSVLDQQDLFPHEGYQFPENRPKPSTNSYRTSDDSPFSTKFRQNPSWNDRSSDALGSAMQTMLKTEQVCNRVAAKAISSPTPGELRPIHSEIARRAINKERGVQMQVKEAQRLQEMRDEDYWSRVERDQGTATTLINQTLRAGVAERKRTLANSYQEQIDLHEQTKSGEGSERRAEERELDILQRSVAAEELDRHEKQRAFRDYQKRVATECTNAVRNRKEAEREAACAYEEFVQEDRAALDQAIDSREARNRQRREDKRRATDLLIERTGKSLEALKVTDNQKFEITDSEVLTRMERERLEKEQERLRANQQRNRDYNSHLRVKDQRMTDVVDVPDFEAGEADIQREADERWRAINLRRLRAVQEKQAEDRKQQEWAETQERRNEDRDKDTMYFLPDNER